MRIISWNTNGLRATIKQGNLDPLLTKYKPDILCLQEIKAELEQIPAEYQHVHGYTLYVSASRARKGYSGVGFYIKDGFDVTAPVNGIGNEVFDVEGRNIVTTIQNKTNPIVLINTYFPNGGGGPERLDYKLKFYDAYLKYVDGLQKKGSMVLFCGDVNTAHTEIDLARPKENADNTGFLPIEREWLDEVVDHGYTDMFRHIHGNIKDVYTYWDQKTAARDRNVGWRIDYFFASAGLVPKIKKFETLTDYMGSDHCPIMVDVEI